uniref:Uncharacterized protein n=1 Tax=Odontella aurita TaxID=265563 RepID=A0A7S4N6H7_9STRA|mmetsp:Transcript_50284/g.151382  ORF Transcript_50284/g.151382 Transcript_50284/m.151382 type:complete len:180 (+) Transcript_50284:259-798(+)
MKVQLTTALAMASLLPGVAGFHLSMNDAGIPSTSKVSEVSSSRRSFFAQATTSFGLVASSSAVGWYGNTQSKHDRDCSCGSCLISFGPSPASAYERRDVGGESRSAETAALNIQAAKTNARLEASGFKLDTREEEATRLSEGLASFSYDSVSSGTKKNGPGRGFSSTSKSGNDVPKKFQ